jgi:hypothetical protein
MCEGVIPQYNTKRKESGITLVLQRTDSHDPPLYVHGNPAADLY